MCPKKKELANGSMDHVLTPERKKASNTMAGWEEGRPG